MTQPMGATTINTKTILLVDDDNIIRRLELICLENFSNWKVSLSIPSPLFHELLRY